MQLSGVCGKASAWKAPGWIFGCGAKLLPVAGWLSGMVIRSSGRQRGHQVNRVEAEGGDLREICAACRGCNS